MNTEEMSRAANTFDNAADQMKRATEQFDTAVDKLERLLGAGWGNNIERLIEVLENAKLPPPVASELKDSVSVNVKFEELKRHVSSYSLDRITFETDLLMDILNSVQLTANNAEVPTHIEAEPIGFINSDGVAILSRKVKGGYLYWGDAPPINDVKSFNNGTQQRGD